MKLSSNRGISIIEAMIAVAIMTGLALSSTYFLTNTNVIGKKNEIKATIDQIHVLQVQRVRNTTDLKNNVRNSFTSAPNSGNITTFNDCFNNTQNVPDCMDFGATKIPTLWSDALSIQNLSGTGTFKMFGEADAFESRVIWNANCTAQYCRSIDVRITTQPVAGKKYYGKLEPRVTVLNFTSQILIDQKSTRFTCTAGNQVAYTINNRLNRAECVPDPTYITPANSRCADQYPMLNFGTNTATPASRCQPPAPVPCAGGGYRSVGFLTNVCRTRT